MTAENKMLFPFTNQKEILDWATRYTKDQSPKRQSQEEDVLKIKCSVADKGYLTKCELMEMGGWKRQTLPSQMVNNPVGHVEKITAAAFRPGDDWEKLKKLIDIDGVGQPVASVILHLYDPKSTPSSPVPRFALSGYRKNTSVDPHIQFWQEYVDLCCAKADLYDVSMRTLDRALWKYSASGAVAEDEHPS